MLNDRASLNKALKYVYEPGLNFAITQSVAALSQFQKKSFPGVGKAYVFATHLKRNTRTASRPADGYYVEGGKETVENGQVNPTYTHIGFGITNDLIKASKGDKAAFKDGMRIVMDTSRETMKGDLNRQFLGDGSGVLGSLAAFAGGAGTVSLAFQAGSSTKFLEEGLAVDVWALAGANRKTDNADNTAPPTKWLEIVSVVDSLNFTAAMSDGSAVPAIAATDVVVKMGNAYGSAGARKCYEANGLRLFADDGTIDPTGGLHGISAASYGRWKGIVKDAGAVDMSPAVASAVGILYKQKSAGKFNAIWAHDNQAHGLIYGAAGSYQDKRYVNGSVTDLGDNEEAVVLNIAGRKVRVNVDYLIDENTLYFLDTSVFRYIELNGVELEEQADGQYLVPYRDATGSKPAQVGYWMWRGNWAVTMRNAVARIYNLKKPTSLPW